jgi:hypothetical protein
LLTQHQRGRLGIDRQTTTPGNPYRATGTICSAERATVGNVCYRFGIVTYMLNVGPASWPAPKR